MNESRFSHFPMGDKGSKTQNGCFPSSSLEESLLQSFLVWTLSATKLSEIHWPIYPCKTVPGRRLLLRENLAEIDQPFSKTPIFNRYSLVAPQP